MFVALFAVPSQWINKQSVLELFADQGVEPRFLSSMDEVMEESERPESLVLFADSLFSPELLGCLPLIKNKNPRVKIILISESMSTQEQSGLRSLGVEDHLVRPVHPSLLVKKTIGLMPFKIVPNRLRQTAATVFTPPPPPRVPVPKLQPKPTLLSALSADLESFRQQWIRHYRGLAPSLDALVLDLKIYEQTAREIGVASPGEKPPGWEQIAKLSTEDRLPLKKLTDLLEDTLKESCAFLGAERVVILSLKPHSLWPKDECPVQLYPMASSDRQIPWKSKALPTVHFPLLPLVFSKRKPLYLTESTPLVVAGLRRHGDWLCQGKAEVASAVVPIFEGETMVAAALIQYASFDPARLVELSKFSASIRELAPLLGAIDFLGRVYREIF